MEDIRREIDRFIFPAILTIFGLILLITGSTTDQPQLFLIAGGAVLVVGITSFLYTLGMISKMLHYILLVAMTGICLFFGVKDFNSINDPLIFAAEKNRRYSVVKQRLKDVRDAEVAFAKRYNRYTASWDSLLNFVRTDSLMEIYSEGQIPENITQAMADTLGLDYYDLIVTGLTEWQCITLAKNDSSFTFIRDTFYKAVEQEVFLNEKALAKRDHPYFLDSLPYVPFSNAQFDLQVGFIEKSGGLKAPVFLAIDSDPFDSTDVYQVGSLDETSTSGNWKSD